MYKDAGTEAHACPARIFHPPAAAADPGAFDGSAPTASHDEGPASGRLTVLSGAATVCGSFASSSSPSRLRDHELDLVLWLSADLGYSDTHAGSLIAAGLDAALYGLVGSSPTRRPAQGLVLGFGICIVARAV